MSALSNADALSGQGEFRSRVPPSEPMTTKGHAPGTRVGNDAVPEFHAQTHAPGTAPPEHTYRPDPVGEIPVQAGDPSSGTGAGDFPGMTSQDAYNGSEMAQPVQGINSRDLHGGLRKKERAGLEGVGASLREGTVEGRTRQLGADLDGDIERGQRGKQAADYPTAEERLPVGAEELAAERN